VAKRTASNKAPGKKASSPKKKASASKPKRSKSSKSKEKAKDLEITLDRRGESDRRDEDLVAEESPAKPPLERRKKVNRRRQIDPTTCERGYTDLEVEFMNAMDNYKRTSGRMFPTCSEVLEVLQSLGYEKLTLGELASRKAAQPQEAAQPQANEENFGVDSDADSLAELEPEMAI